MKRVARGAERAPYNISKRLNFIHGVRRHPVYAKTYRSWYDMLRRCYSPKNIMFHNYGGRGIKVCKRWHSFANFVADMGVRPKGTSIDRIDNDKDYYKGNCRWATGTTQANNKRSNIRLAHNGQILSIAQWARRLGIPESAVYQRYKAGWATNKILKSSVGPEILTFNGKKMSLHGWANYLGVCYLTLYRRRKRGWSIEKTLRTEIDKSKNSKR